MIPARLDDSRKGDAMEDRNSLLKTIPAKAIVTRTKNRSWFGTDYTMNIYRGCCHGCIYCDSRSECYHIDEFDRVRAKENALEIIRDDLRRKAGTGVVGTGAMSDPYNPFEREALLTRHALELLAAFGFGAVVATKSDLIARDADVLQEIAADSPVLCQLTVTTADDGLAAKLEPRAPAPSARFEALRALSRAGVYTGVLLMPVLPFLEDGEENIRAVAERAAECGARFVYPFFGVTLRQNQREYYFDRLEEAFPGAGLAARYRRQYGSEYSCRSPRIRALRQAFEETCGRCGLLYKMQDIIRGYTLGYSDRQLRLF